MRRLEHFPNLVTMFFTRAEEKGDAPFLWSKHDGAWQPISWRAAADTVARLATALQAIGLERGDRVMLVSENRPEWCLADLAIMAAGCVTVPTYTTNTERDHAHIIENSGAKAVIVSAGRDDTSILIVLTARGLAPGVPLSVVIRSEDNEPLARQAGATTVINPASFAGLLLAGSTHGEHLADYIADLAAHVGVVGGQAQDRGVGGVPLGDREERAAGRAQRRAGEGAGKHADQRDADLHRREKLARI